jgi:primosomal replication protein N
LGSNLKVTGFLAAKGRTSRALVLHATEIEFDRLD